MGHVPRAKKGNFLVRGRGRPTVHGGRTSGILSIRGPEGSLGSLWVRTIHVQSPTPHASPLPAYFGQFSHQCGLQNHELLKGHPFYEYRQGISLGIATVKRVFCPHIKGKHHESHVDAGVARDFSIKLALAIERRRNGTNASSLRGWTRPAPFSVPLEESKYQQYTQRACEAQKKKRRGGKPKYVEESEEESY